ncbi:hypothetical protein E4T48_06146 [Aureobasidium sp. EXF-10727]|nr:hypothetical protein E4T48_06146 [Aureobasidium sp. EXF-10727]
MESPRSVKRRKLETIPESPQRTTNTTPRPPPAANKTPRRDDHDARDTIRVASVATPSSLNLTPSKPTPRPAPTSATKSNSKIGGLMARLNAKIAENQSPQKSPVKNGNGTPVRAELQEVEKSAKVKTLSQKLRETFEQEQLERAAKRKPKRTLEDQMREIQETSKREDVGGEMESEVIKVQPRPTQEKRKPGRPRKHPVVQADTADENDGSVSPSKLASARKPQTRDMSPMLLHGNGTRQPLFTPRKGALSTPLKQPRPQAMIDLDIAPAQTNASANLCISADHLQVIQTAVLDQLQERTHTPFTNLSSEYEKLAHVINQTIVAGESNSILVIGARGTGKSAIVDTILADQARQNPDLFHAVRLNGFIHTDDKMALRDIWRQLGREMSLDDDDMAKNAADTLTTLLALLSHPEELGRPADQVTKSVIFVLDEFDLFTTHPRQTLLYNLFDIAQSRKAPIAVIGTTTRFDVVEQLEKRVKSRFSHRHVHLSSAANLSIYREMCQNALLPFAAVEKVSEDAHTTWKTIINDLFSTEHFNTHLRSLYYTTKSLRCFHTSMLLSVSTLPSSPTSAPIPAESLLEHLGNGSSLTALLPPDSKLAALSSLSSLQLALLISAARLTIIHATETVTFPLAHAEYVSLASRAKIAASAAGNLVSGVGRVWSKDVARAAWEGLERKKLVLAEGQVGAYRVDVRLEEIGDTQGSELGVAMGRWCREI